MTELYYVHIIVSQLHNYINSVLQGHHCHWPNKNLSQVVQTTICVCQAAIHQYRSLEITGDVQVNIWIEITNLILIISNKLKIFK